MTRIDFYILQDVGLSAAYRFACRLASRAISEGHPAVVHADGESAAQEVDELLWHYPEQRFLPHALETRETAPTPAAVPLLVTWQAPSRFDGVLVNLSPSVPDFFGRFDRVFEIIVQETRDHGRARYKFYRDRGFPLYHHEMDDWESPAAS